MTIELVSDNDVGGKRDKYRRCLRCKKTIEEILQDRPNLKKVFWRKGICDSCFHKLKRKCRNKQIEKNSNIGKGFRIEQVVAKALDIENCNIKLDNFNTIFDLYDPVKYKDIQVKSTEIKLMVRTWIKNDGTEGKREYLGYNIHVNTLREFDYLFIVCMTSDYKDIDRVYTIPVDRLSSERISIYVDLYCQYDDCRDEELLQKLRNVYHSMKIENCPIIKDDEEIENN